MFEDITLRRSSYYPDECNYSSKFINWEASAQLSSALAMLPAFSKFKIGYSLLYLPNLSHPISSSSTFSSELKTLTLLLQGHISTPHILQIHARIFRFDADQNDLIATRLIGHYPPEFSLRVFNHLRNPNIFPSNAIIRVLSEERLLLQAISIFKFLKTRSLSPNDFTFSFLLKACFQSTDARNVKQIHTHIVKSGFNLNSDVCNGLLAVYAKGVRDLVSAQIVFDEMPHKVMVFSWTCLIAGYAKLNRSEEVLALFLRMIEGNLMPEDDTMVSILSACSGLEIRELEKWQKLLSDFDGSNDNVNGFLHDSADTILIYLYGKQGKIEMSRELFDRIAGRGGTKRSVLPWNTMINCYAQNCLPLEALSLFRLMITGSNPRPNHVTMVSVLSSCAQVGDLDLGRWVHNYMKTGRHKGLLESNTFLATAFIDMYSKCGNLERAKEVFDTMTSKDVVAFNAMIMSLAINGKGEEALNLFSKMIENGINPNGGTFLGILSACNHSGLISEGRRVFKNMTLDYSIVPELEHYACYTDLLARMGYIEEALEVVNSMPVEPNGLVWGALLGGCLANSRVDLAFDIARRLVKVDPNNSGGYVMLSNVYASGHRWSELSELRGLMKERGVRKQPGCSWISVDGVVHEFIVGSTSHPQIQKTYNVLDGLSKEMRSVGA